MKGRFDASETSAAGTGVELSTRRRLSRRHKRIGPPTTLCGGPPNRPRLLDLCQKQQRGKGGSLRGR